MKIKILVFDTETTGLPLVYQPAEKDLNNYPFVLQYAGQLIEIDLDNLSKPYRIIYSINSYINPVRKGKEIQIHPKSLEVHGITLEKAKEEGNIIETVALLHQGMANSADILLCHNYFFDRNVMASELLNLNIIPKAANGARAFCTMKYSTDIMQLPNKKPNTFKFPSLEEAYEFWTEGKKIEDHYKPHDALEDVGATIEILRNMLDQDDKIKAWFKKEITEIY